MNGVCPKCDETVPMDGEYTRVRFVPEGARDSTNWEEYYLHDECAVEITDDWGHPLRPR